MFYFNFFLNAARNFFIIYFQFNTDILPPTTSPVAALPAAKKTFKWTASEYISELGKNIIHAHMDSAAKAAWAAGIAQPDPRMAKLIVLGLLAVIA